MARLLHKFVINLGFQLVCSTVAMLERNGRLKVASVGDCGLRVIRKGKYQIVRLFVIGSLFSLTFCFSLITAMARFSHLIYLTTGQIIFTTSPQEHYFDCPYQLSSELIGQTYLDAVV